MRGYLGTSTKNRPSKTGTKAKGGANRRRRRRPPQREYPDDEGSLEVIPPEQLEASKNMMNLAKATFEGLLSMRTKRDVAAVRGVEV